MPELTPEIERELAALDDALAGRRVAPDLTELGELALALREERQRPTEGFGRYLDNRVERGFPGRDPRVRASRSGRRWWQAFMTVPAFGMAAAVLLVAVIVVADPAGDDSEGGGGGAGGQVAAEPQAPSAGAAESAGGGLRSSSAEDSAAGAEPDSATTSSEPLPPLSVPPVPAPGSPGADGKRNRAVERSASLTLAARPRDIDAVSREIQRVTQRYDGFVLSSAVSSSPSGGGGDFQLRIPTRNLDNAVAALSSVPGASVRERSQGRQDITAERVSARTRLRDARTERKSLLRQLAEADTPNETASIRQRLDIVSNEIQAARAAVRRVVNRATFSTVSVTLVADRNAGSSGVEEDDNWTPGDAANDALRVLEVAAGVALIVLAVALPLALLAFLAAIAARWTRRRRREQALDAV